MIKNGEPNPLNIFNLRRLEYCAPHLEKVHFECRVHDKILLDWIYENLESRFYYNDDIVLENGAMVVKKCVAFENPSDATYFCLVLDTINHSVSITF